MPPKVRDTRQASGGISKPAEPFGVRVPIVLPGRSPETNFGSNARPHLRGMDNPDYAPLLRRESTGGKDAELWMAEADL